MKTQIGTVARINEGRGFGFITTGTGPGIFFHLRDLQGLTFDERLIEQRVEFELFESEKGPKACNVRAA